MQSVCFFVRAIISFFTCLIMYHLFTVHMPLGTLLWLSLITSELALHIINDIKKAE